MGEVTCLYCLQSLKNMEDPKQLPCGHTCCLECLKGEYHGSLNSFTCPSCRAVYEPVDFDSLPSPPPSTKGNEEGDNLLTATAKLKCDKCTDEEGKKQAVRYCSDCGEKSCAHHIQCHDGYFGDQHDTVDIMVYAKNPSKYNKAITCQLHKKIITMACGQCFVYNCLTCDRTNGTYCTVTGGKHEYQSLEQVETAIRSVFASLLQNNSEKVTKIDTQEKTAFEKMDQLVVDCEGMLAEVEKKTEEQIDTIRQYSGQLKTRIKTYQKERSDQVMQYVTQLTDKRERVEEARIATSRFLRDIHVTDLIKEQDMRKQIITEANNINLGTCNWTNQQLRIGDKRQLEIDLSDEGAKTKPYHKSQYQFYHSTESWKPAYYIDF